MSLRTAHNKVRSMPHGTIDVAAGRQQACNIVYAWHETLSRSCHALLHSHKALACMAFSWPMLIPHGTDLTPINSMQFMVQQACPIPAALSLRHSAHVPRSCLHIRRGPGPSCLLFFNLKHPHMQSACPLRPQTFGFRHPLLSLIPC